ncbi:MAG: hypothetical protein IJ716_14650 [Lachnospiraceae bacterium]|nr:hypothetical protein [Lachnospiraceae bacterium]
MVKENVTICPKCGGKLKHYDTIRRRVLGKSRLEKRVFVERLRCLDCKSYHHAIPALIFPYKHYDAEIIQGVLDGYITPETLGYEDYPCEMTMTRWRARILHSSL